MEDCECSQCGHTGPIEEFYPDHTEGDDWLVCPECGSGGMADDFQG
ncbi:hypothetical protein C8E08_4639 [Paracidovorax citrulli]|nr:hypothetical protein C8E08_4639 [Paracidovorax citrulli]REG68636.1 hypothetical protein C8E07_1753 [Paracidovorax citrulli]RLJ93191.1 hypothetical protein C8E06_1753 [Paracidovorax citrulli]